MTIGIIGGLEWFTKGGWAMWPLLLLSVFSLWVILNRLMFFAVQIPKINHQLENVLASSNLLSDRIPGELAPVLARAIKGGKLDRDSAQMAAERELLKAAMLLNSLETVAMVAPLLGLTGTVTGMVRVFQQVAELQGAVNPSLLASGIWEALLTTVAGLIITIPALVGYRYFRSRLVRWENMMLSLIDDVAQAINDGSARKGSDGKRSAEVIPAGERA